jgi:hypothetical protein
MSGETEAIAIANLARGLGQPSAGEAEDARRIQAGIDVAMREVIASAGHNPNRIDAPAKVGIAGAVPVAPSPPLTGRGTGWQEPGPLASPPGQDVIERLVNASLPHGAGSLAGRRPKEEG